MNCNCSCKPRTKYKNATIFISERSVNSFPNRKEIRFQLPSSVGNLISFLIYSLNIKGISKQKITQNLFSEHLVFGWREQCIHEGQKEGALFLSNIKN